MAARKHDDKSPTLDEHGKTVAEVNAPTRMVQPYRDYGIDQPFAKTESAAKMAAQTQPIAESPGVRGVLETAELVDGTFVMRLTHASASMHAFMQIAHSKGEEIEIVIKRRQ